MGFFTRTAMDMLMKTTHPEINRRQCWNLHPHRKPCTECKDICPYGEQIFTRPNLVKDWDPCTECGLCVSACRSGCIIPSPEQVQRDTSAADTDNDTIWIGCEKSTRKNSMVRACISGCLRAGGCPLPRDVLAGGRELACRAWTLSCRFLRPSAPVLWR